MHYLVRGRVAALGALALSLSCFAGVVEARESDAQVKQKIVKQSIASYSGNCPCPYNSARNGSRCGGRSAYSRGGGAAPLCYPSDVSKADVEAYRRR